jgi:biotin carboxyl carrier protein
VTFEVEIAGGTHTVSVEALGAAGPDGGRFRLLVDGQPCELDMSRTDLGLSLIYREDGRAVDVATTERPGGDWLLQLPHVTLSATVDGRRGRGRAGQVATRGEQRLSAPMPGRVVRVLVKPGDEVAARQGLIVVEAMKMENELTSPRAGRVREVAVNEGQSVEAGRLLIVVE